MILVAGATGYVGRYLCVTLAKQGREVLALGRNPKVEGSGDISLAVIRYSGESTVPRTIRVRSSPET